MSESFRASRLKVDRAKAHIQEIENYIAAHLEKHPPIFTRERVNPADEWSATNTHLTVKGFGDEIGPMVGDVIHNLRASLDLMAVDLVKAAGKNHKSVYFPFCEISGDIDEMITKRNFHRAGPDAVALLKQFAPYTGGNDALRGLHDLDIQDKHHTIIPVLNVISTPDYTVDIHEDGRVRLLMPDSFDPKDLLGVTFPDGGAFSHQPLVPTLHDLVQLTEGILEAFATLVAART
ncbi:MAG: hypothetical protein KF779_14230 [Hyphomonadaceae bacterium]|nr:hypothetical protein [Hyphomonadaceae bacterium]